MCSTEYHSAYEPWCWSGLCCFWCVSLRVLLCAFGASINSMSSLWESKTHLTSPGSPFQYQKLLMRTFRSYLKVQLPWEQEGELYGVWMFHHKALPERSGRGAQAGRGFGVRDGLLMESRAQRIWQQVLTVRGPQDDCNWHLPNSPPASTVKKKWIKNKNNKNKTTTCRKIPLLHMKRGVELQDVCRVQGGSRCCNSLWNDIH